MALRAVLGLPKDSPILSVTYCLAGIEPQHLKSDLVWALPQATMEAFSTLLEDLVPGTVAFWMGD